MRALLVFTATLLAAVVVAVTAAADTCACGGSYPTVVGSYWYASGGYCVTTFDYGPSANPRYRYEPTAASSPGTCP